MSLPYHWHQTTNKVFWGEIAPCNHLLQIYENDDTFLDLLTDYVQHGIASDDCVIVIATDAHLHALERRLSEMGYAISHLRQKEQYIPLDAEVALAQFMINGWPDEARFNHLVQGLFKRAQHAGRHVKAFGEMVAILWAKGQMGATVQLEHLWTKICDSVDCTLLCSYPRSGFTQDAVDSVKQICMSHARLIGDFSKSTSAIFHRDTETLRSS